jgi:sulfur-oxidizing protein SoxY
MGRPLAVGLLYSRTQAYSAFAVEPAIQLWRVRRIAGVGATMNPQRMMHRRALLAVMAAGAAGRRAAAQGKVEEDPWPSLAAQIFDGRTLQDGSTILAIDAPYRAEDAALVPVGLHSLLPDDDKRHIRHLALVIDQNPSPLAAVFSPNPTSGIRSLSTRVRVDSYTNIHAVAELSDDRLYAATRFVKAAGGCSAPAAKMEANAIPLGTMRFRQFPAAADGAASSLREAELLVRHPNYTGMQMDQLTRLYVPAHFVNHIRIWHGDDLLLSIEGGISISENPEFRFDYRPTDASSFRTEVDDSEGQSFKQEWPAAPA